MSITLTAAEAAIGAAVPGAQRRSIPAPSGEVEIVDVTHDSRRVQAGWLYAAITGDTYDGHDFVGDAEAMGAAALLVEHRVDTSLPTIEVETVRRVLGPLAAAVHGRPSDDCDVVGITGTNGKTTVTYLLESIFGASARGTGVIGTIETRIHGAALKGVHTTPEAPDLQRLLRLMVIKGVDGVAVEVSSHGLHQHRVDGTRFRVGVFTNLTEDHLDYHQTMEGYYLAKRRLWVDGLAEFGVICVDDDWGQRLATESLVPVITFGRERGDVRYECVQATSSGCIVAISTLDESVEVRTPLIGRHNAANVTAAWLAAQHLGIAPETAALGVAACQRVPGRLDPVTAGQTFTVLVDYAHTPDALEHAMGSARELLPAGGRLWVVVGCGGDRDKKKRPMMGRISMTADIAILTSDNPRSEDPRAIIDDMLSDGAAGAVVEVDRRAAIEKALIGATGTDVVLIAGKGHEAVQEFAGRAIEFDDRNVAEQILGRMLADVVKGT